VHARGAADDEAFGGSIITISSSLAFNPNRGFAAYVASKGGLVSLTKAIAAENGPIIRANVVAPSAVDTAFLAAGQDRTIGSKPTSTDMFPAFRCDGSLRLKTSLDRSFSWPAGSTLHHWANHPCHGAASPMMRLAPHLGLTSIHDGLFIHHAGADPLRQIEFIAERGFAGIEDNFLQLRPAEVQVRIGEALARNGLAMGCFLATLTLDRRRSASTLSTCRNVEVRASAGHRNR